MPCEGSLKEDDDVLRNILVSKPPSSSCKVKVVDSCPSLDSSPCLDKGREKKIFLLKTKW